MNSLIEKTLENRGLTVEQLKELNNPTHGPLDNADELCAALYDIWTAGKHIVILPDYDMDGIMSGVVGYAGMTELGFNVSLYCPNPNEGYGFIASTIDDLVAKFPGTQAIITCDVGITCEEGVNRADELGIEVLVTDHHKSNFAPTKARVSVDPMLPDSTYEHPYICGAHVLWQILMRYAKTYCDEAALNRVALLRVFAGIGTVSDSMTLWYENRLLVRNAVSICRKIFVMGEKTVWDSVDGCEIYKWAFTGLYTVLKHFAEAGKIKTADDINEDFFGFYMAPTFNAVKRMGVPTENAFGVFFSDNQNAYITFLMELNEKRKTLVEAFTKEIKSVSQPCAPFIYLTTANTGITGLLATRLMDETGVPTLVLTRTQDGRYEGSGRSPEWFPFLSHSSKFSVQVAGHESAFGALANSLEDIQELFEYLSAAVPEAAEHVKFVERKPDFVISPMGDGDTDIDTELFLEYLSDLEHLRPFGAGFEAPYVELRFPGNIGYWSTIGSDKSHLRITLQNAFKVLCWGQADKMSTVENPGVRHVFGHLEKNVWKDTVSVNFIGDLKV